MYKPPVVPLQETARAQPRKGLLLTIQQEAEPVPEDFGNQIELKYLQGTLMTSRGLIHVEPGEFTPSDLEWLSIDEAAQAVGSFVAVFRDHKHEVTKVLGDFHGFQEIFYFESAATKTTLVSDSYLFLIQEIKRIGHSIGLDTGIVYGQYSSFNALLNHHAFSDRTIVEGVKYLRSGQILNITCKGSSVELNDRMLDPHNRPYNELIQDALSRGTQFVEAALEWDVPEHLLYLSGGRDSRGILAMAIHGGLERNLEVFAKQPPIGESNFSQKLGVDRALSAQLVDTFGLKLWEDSQSVKLASNAGDREWWLSHRAGVSHDFSAPRIGSLEPTVKLIGAMGANYRTKVPDYLGHMNELNLGMTEDSYLQDFDQYFNRICVPHPGAPNGAWESTRDAFEQALNVEGAGSALWERLDAFSELYRMPAHFGSIGLEKSVNIWNLNILAIPELTYAASITSRDERAAGKIWRDLHSLADPRINEIPYEFEIKDGRGGYGSLDSSSTEVKWSKLDAIHHENLQKNSLQLSDTSPKMISRNDWLACKHLLAKHEATLVNQIGKPRWAHLRNRVQKRGLLAKRLRGKLELLNQVLDPEFVWNPTRVSV